MDVIVIDGDIIEAVRYILPTKGYTPMLILRVKTSTRNRTVVCKCPHRNVEPCIMMELQFSNFSTLILCKRGFTASASRSRARSSVWLKLGGGYLARFCYSFPPFLGHSGEPHIRLPPFRRASLQFGSIQASLRQYHPVSQFLIDHHVVHDDGQLPRSLDFHALSIITGSGPSTEISSFSEK